MSLGRSCLTFLLVFLAERLLRLVGYLQMTLQRLSQWGIVFGWL